MAGLVFITGCGEDDPVEVDPLVGNYKLSSAIYLGLFNLTDLTTDEVPMTVQPQSSPVSKPVIPGLTSTTTVDRQWPGPMAEAWRVTMVS